MENRKNFDQIVEQTRGNLLPFDHMRTALTTASVNHYLALFTLTKMMHLANAVACVAGKALLPLEHMQFRLRGTSEYDHPRIEVFPPGEGLRGNLEKGPGGYISFTMDSQGFLVEIEKLVVWQKGV